MNRLRALGLSDEELGQFLYVEPDEPMTEPSILADVERLLEECRPSLVVFDSLTAALSLHVISKPLEAALLSRVTTTMVVAWGSPPSMSFLATRGTTTTVQIASTLRSSART